MTALDASRDALHPDDAAPGARPCTPGPDTCSQPDLATLVDAARRGEPAAWQGLVQRFAPLVRTITGRYRLSEHDAEDVGQVTWLRLVEHLSRLREPLALPGWIATTARHESLRLARAHGRTLPVDPLDGSAPEFTGTDPEVDADLLHAEEVEAVREGLAALPPAQRDLLLLLAADPPLSYREISTRLGMPIGSIGPTRARTLARLGATPAVSRYLGSGRRRTARRTCAA
ncbi:RNA polymerase sigma factor (sigma-70 family) [Geodermatophilus bullaregiensis]|uniref:RNA polymerase sigma factor n=1 Tax=Geodermatophilus bullaregiensis TaxID=1564160 RepID=UPI00195B83F3|nr:sigma-70 family RNA polymerase sigma factor [Geodermatophilus bullaregiensis]MBM7807645.1 RNA polymerase sigma factor (sigma-70 family) [Geodermatophilus bullaregiensis]